MNKYSKPILYLILSILNNIISLEILELVCPSPLVVIWMIVSTLAMAVACFRCKSVMALVLAFSILQANTQAVRAQVAQACGVLVLVIGGVLVWKAIQFCNKNLAPAPSEPPAAPSPGQFTVENRTPVPYYFRLYSESSDCYITPGITEVLVLPEATVQVSVPTGFCGVVLFWTGLPWNDSTNIIGGPYCSTTGGKYIILPNGASRKIQSPVRSATSVQSDIPMYDVSGYSNCAPYTAFASMTISSSTNLLQWDKAGTVQIWFNGSNSITAMYDTNGASLQVISGSMTNSQSLSLPVDSSLTAQFFKMENNTNWNQ